MSLKILEIDNCEDLGKRGIQTIEHSILVGEAIGVNDRFEKTAENQHGGILIKSLRSWNMLDDHGI